VATTNSLGRATKSCTASTIGTKVFSIAADNAANRGRSGSVTVQAEVRNNGAQSNEPVPEELWPQVGCLACVHGARRLNGSLRICSACCIHSTCS
jgi:hypothetical protein